MMSLSVSKQFRRNIQFLLKYAAAAAAEAALHTATSGQANEKISVSYNNHPHSGFRLISL